MHIFKVSFFIIILMFVSGYVLTAQVEQMTPRQSDGFVYEDCGCQFGELQLTVYNGGVLPYGGQMVEESKEESPGAVCLANMNDTDGDFHPDHTDGLVFTTGSRGRGEVDLMKLEISVTGQLAPHCSHVRIEHSPELLFWGGRLKHAFPLNLGLIPVSSLPRTVYVEAIDHSTSVRDLWITAQVETSTGIPLLGNSYRDMVRITAVWADLRKRYWIEATSGIENPSPSMIKMDQPNAANFVEFVYKKQTGERYGMADGSDFNSTIYYNLGAFCQSHVNLYAGEPALWAPKNLFEFAIFPTDLNKDNDNNGVRDMQDLGVYFDVTRRVQNRDRRMRLNDESWTEIMLPNGVSYDEDFPANEETSNDDMDNSDEDVDLMFQPSGQSTSSLFSIDAPGFLYNGLFAPGARLYKNALCY